jgi:DnaJ-class molecular chaperone
MKRRRHNLCKVCGYDALVQDFGIYPSMNAVCGGITTRPPILIGCHCSNCGTRFSFNKHGICPGCYGTGIFVAIHSRLGIDQYHIETKCSACNGAGRI